MFQAFPTYTQAIPTLTTEQMIEVDRLMIEEYHIQLIQMMENAGRCLALLANRAYFPEGIQGKSIAVLAGSGGNGGGALVAARRLFNWGADVQVVLSSPAEKMKGIPLHQLTIVRRMGIPVFEHDQVLPDSMVDLILDGLIGYSIKGNPRGRAKELIEWANHSTVPILSLDTPSGLDLTSGTAFEPTIRATATLTLALPKQGLFTSSVHEYRGSLFLGDISVPPKLYAEPSLNLSVPSNLFAQSDIIRIE